MAQSARIGLVAALLVLAADVVVLATGAASDDAAPTTTALAPSTTLAGAGTTLPGETTLATDTTAVAAGETTTTPPVTVAETTTTAPPQSLPPTARTMPAPGTYTMNVTGSETGQYPFTVEPLSATDQRQTSQGAQGATVQVMRYTPSAVQLVSLDLAGFKQFAPSPPVQFAPVPLALGATWSWRMASTDAKTTIDHTSTVSGFERIPVAGRQVATFVIETTLDLSGDVQGTITVTSWAAPDFAMAVRTHQVMNVRFGLFTIASDTTSELVSLDPA